MHLPSRRNNALSSSPNVRSGKWGSLRSTVRPLISTNIACRSGRGAEDAITSFDLHVQILHANGVEFDGESLQTGY